MLEKVHEDVIYLLLNSMLYNMFLKFFYLLLVLKIFHLAVSILCLVVYTTSVHDSVCYPNSPDCLLGKRGKKEFFYKLRMRKRSYVIIQEYLKHHFSPEFPILPPGCSSELWISCIDAMREFCSPYFVSGCHVFTGLNFGLLVTLKFQNAIFEKGIMQAMVICLLRRHFHWICKLYGY